MTTRFDDDTALTSVGATSFAGTIRSAWSVGRGPNGGYVAALILRALTMTVGDSMREPRSLTIQYLAPSAEGPIRIDTTVERSGGSLTMLSARMSQHDRTVALALSTFATSREGIAFSAATMPNVPPAARITPFVRAWGPHPAFTAQYEYRWAIGDLPFTGSEHARVGGWIRLAEPRPADALLVAAYTDAWIPSVYPRLTAQMGTPTVDLTIHFRTRLPLPDMRDEDFYLAVFQSRLAAEGFFEEDGEIWSPGGVLIAQSRQMALLRPMPA
ncbi:MAG TPA: thioesterase family protein [Ktedonobacterales bacterium]